MHEEDTGIAWKHVEYRSGRNDMRRGRRLALQFVATVANYDYLFNTVRPFTAVFARKDQRMLKTCSAEGSLGEGNECSSLKQLAHLSADLPSRSARRGGTRARFWSFDATRERHDRPNQTGGHVGEGQD